MAIAPQLYDIRKLENEVQVNLVGNLKPSVRKQRKSCLLEALEALKDAGSTNVGVKLIEMTSKAKYKSAVEIIAENVLSVSAEPDISEDENQFEKRRYEKISQKIRQKQRLKSKRDQEVEKRRSTWEAERLKKLKQLLTKIFACASRKYLSVKTVISTLQQSGHRSCNVINDIQKLAAKTTYQYLY